ncbi:MAG: glutamate-cysteine ligase family protein [Bdellovibrionota bacterium]
MMAQKSLGLFEGYGIELEYMIVDRDSLRPLFICDKVLEDMAGKKTMSFEDGVIAWSNELALHVIEIKCNGPQVDLDAVSKGMAEAVVEMNGRLSKYNAQLLSTAMHPYFNPNDGSLKLWSGDDVEIYSAYDRIFGCKGHGWGNLQSIHINLPFSSDDEFFRLHSAVRLLLPLLPAFAASSPFVEGKNGPLHDSRLHFYLENQRRIPSIIGDAIPEPVMSEAEYIENILEPMYRDISKVDSAGVLQHEWLNSRTAIARFDRKAIEIRILDIQESILADFTLIKAIVESVKNLVFQNQPEQHSRITQGSLKNILYGTLKDQNRYLVQDDKYCDIVGGKSSVKDIFRYLAPNALSSNPVFLTENLAERLLKSLGKTPTMDELVSQYKVIGSCLAENRFYGV